jgi:hypothetical protein
MTIGDERNYSIKAAQAEATNLKSMTDKGIDPRQVKAEQIASDNAKRKAQQEKVAIDALKSKIDSMKVSEAWDAYVKERTASMLNGKPEWGTRHKEH